jgi:hypothetical protein
MALLLGLMASSGACGRAPLVAARGAAGALGLGGATSTGGAQGVGGARGPVGSSGTGGAAAADTTCVSVAELPSSAAAICAFTGNYDQGYGCDKLSVRIAADPTSYYFVTEAGRSVARCPRDRPNAVPMLSMETYRDGVYHLLSGEILPSGLISLGCTIRDPAGPGSGYRYACTADGIQVVQSDPKGGSLYLELPGPGRDAGGPGYRGHLRDYPYCLMGEGRFSSITYTSASDDALVLDQQPLICSVDDQSISFRDLDGRLLMVVFGAGYRMLHVGFVPPI